MTVMIGINGSSRMGPQCCRLVHVQVRVDVIVPEISENAAVVLMIMVMARPFLCRIRVRISSVISDGIVISARIVYVTAAVFAETATCRGRGDSTKP